MTEEAGAYDAGSAGLVPNPSPGSPALVIVDVQQGFDERTEPRNNPDGEANVAALLAAWRAADWPIVRVRHDSVDPDSRLRPDRPGNAIKPEVAGAVDLEISKSVHSSFHGDIDLAWWLRESAIDTIVVCGVQTNMCCETTARIGSDLGFTVWFALDATWTYDQVGLDGTVITADTLAAVTASTLATDFCEIVSTAEAIARTTA